MGAEETVADGETAVPILLGLEAAAERFAGGVVAGEQQADHGVVGSEPSMGAAVEEEQFPLALASLPATMMGLASAHGSAEAGGPQEASERLVGDADALFDGQDVGEV